MENDILINKAATIERCINRVREEHAKAGANFASDYSRQDAAILNIQRACQAALDMGQHIVRTKWVYRKAHVTYLPYSLKQALSTTISLKP